MFFLTFPYIYFLSLVGTLKKFIGVLTLEHIIWLNGSLPTECLEAFLQDHQLSLSSGSRIEKMFPRNLFPLSIRGKKKSIRRLKSQKEKDLSFLISIKKNGDNGIF
jgi:hypothetical protein